MKTATRGCILILVIIAGVGLAFFFLSGPRTPSHPSTFAVEYRITGTAPSVDVTYQNASGGTEQRHSVRLPFSFKFTAAEGQFLYISAQNDGQSGSVVCQILLNDVEQKRSESSGAFVIADCSGKFQY